MRYCSNDASRTEGRNVYRNRNNTSENVGSSITVYFLPLQIFYA